MKIKNRLDCFEMLKKYTYIDRSKSDFGANVFCSKILFNTFSSFNSIRDENVNSQTVVDVKPTYKS